MMNGGLMLVLILMLVVEGRVCMLEERVAEDIFDRASREGHHLRCRPRPKQLLRRAAGLS